MSGGISPSDLRTQVIRPTCTFLGLGGVAVEELLLGTAMQESACGARIVQNGGPALGVWQMEPTTHKDIWENFLAYQAPLAAKVNTFLFTALPKSEQMKGNLYYACAMARIDYFRHERTHPIPAAGDIAGQAALYKAIYNGPGKATEAEFVANAKSILA